MTREISPGTRKEIFLTHLRQGAAISPGRRYTVGALAEELNVPYNYFSTDLRKWMDLPEFEYIHRAGSGGAGDPFLYWFDDSHPHDDLPTRSKRGPRKDKGKPRKTPPVSSTLPERVTPSFVRQGGGRRAPSGALPVESMAMIIFREGNRVILIDDQDHLIRGQFVD